MPTIDLPHGPTHYEVNGSGAPLVLLHGGFCSAEAMREIGEALAPSYEVHAPERPGHGRTADVEGPFAYSAMVEHTLAYLDALNLPKAHLVGFSDGAITGLLLARDHADRVASLVAIAANLDPSGFVSDEEAAGTMSAEQHQQLTDEYARLSPDGGGHEDVVVGKLVELWKQEPQIAPESLAGVTAPTLVMAADRDMISLEHTALIARSIPRAQLCIVPGAGHLLIRERPQLIATIVREFLAQ
ncbi:alpha/beta hydrolase [Kineosporia sp. NBRC 101677]|uniref:alpha/beta fold hydrolase n=1 Tax=Kineosporia sp. NBRC 101677 TaxID=3032197 RepID=UPI0024A1A954|nr:alpha/beta hydrolase [Kineosporia sp. NBRC 101677]GLY15071.1 alpha/beta hydrolase [Kineosporia sp. NBRC 101677]